MKIETVLLIKFAIAKSFFPSKLKSPWAIREGEDPAVNVEDEKFNEAVLAPTGRNAMLERIPVGPALETVTHPVPLFAVKAAGTTAVSFVADT
jgi:hypothetical protein